MADAVPYIHGVLLQGLPEVEPAYVDGEDGWLVLRLEWPTLTVLQMERFKRLEKYEPCAIHFPHRTLFVQSQTSGPALECVGDKTTLHTELYVGGREIMEVPNG